MRVVCFLLLFGMSICHSSSAIHPNQIPIEAARWYQLNNTSNGLEGLFDSITNVSVTTGWGKILGNYDAYYPLLDGETIDIDSIKFYDGQGTNEYAPFTLFAVTSQWQRIPMAVFIGSRYNEWVGPSPDSSGPNQFKTIQHVKDIRYLLINTSGAYPDEMEIYGSYTAPGYISPEQQKQTPLKQIFGVNAFEWDFENPADPLYVDSVRMSVIKNFTAVRHYMDWEKLELAEGSYTFNPCHSGGWNYDTIYARCKMEGIEVLADLKTIPWWMQESYPVTERDAENVPLRYGKDFSKPESYIEQAKIAFQFAARYGDNADVNSDLLSVNSTTRWNNDPANVVKKGLGLIKYIECDNERDKWWKGRKAYQTGREYAANMSAFYDGHKGSMGVNVGVKTADPSMQVVMGGVATINTDYLMGMIDWCKEFRGYNTDGSINLCWDVINYHIYNNDAKNSQSNNSTRGAAPEAANADGIAKQFISVAHRYAADMPVWVTETGYDVHQGSPLKAVPIGNKNVLEVQADWILRTALLYARSGVDRVFFYQLYDENIYNPGKFASSGLINADRSRKPAADYLFQTNKLLGNYRYMETLSKNPIVDRYELNGASAYVLVKPSENGSSVIHTLSLGTIKQAAVYTPAIGQDSMKMQIVSTQNGNLQLTVSETPVFVIPILSGSRDTLISDIDKCERLLKIFPNPVTDQLNIILQSNSKQNVEITIFSLTGQVYKKLNCEKSSRFLIQAIDCNCFKPGIYILKLKQDNEIDMRKIIKLD